LKYIITKEGNIPPMAGNRLLIVSRNWLTNKFYSDPGRRTGYAGTKRYRRGVKGSKRLFFL